MKQMLTVLGIAILIFLMMCSNPVDENSQKNLHDVSWLDEKDSPLKLVRPLTFSEGSRDVYGDSLKSDRWYIISEQSECYFVPVSRLRMKNFIEKKVSKNRQMLTGEEIAVLDTVSARFLTQNGRFVQSGSSEVNDVEIICFSNGVPFPRSYFIPF